MLIDSENAENNPTTAQETKTVRIAEIFANLIQTMLLINEDT
jgi:hypothetical protein